MNYKLKKLAYHITSWNIKPKYIQGVFINTFITVNLKKLLNKKGKKFESPFKVSFKTHALYIVVIKKLVISSISMEHFFLITYRPLWTTKQKY